MAPEERCSGRRYFSPSLISHAIFSQVTITSPKAASTKGLPESMEATLPNAKHMHVIMLRCFSKMNKTGLLATF